jgi:hypothetical protein
MEWYKLTLTLGSADLLTYADKVAIGEWLKTMPINGYLSSQCLEQVGLNDIKMQGRWDHV